MQKKTFYTLINEDYDDIAVNRLSVHSLPGEDQNYESTWVFNINEEIDDYDLLSGTLIFCLYTSPSTPLSKFYCSESWVEGNKLYMELHELDL